MRRRRPTADLIVDVGLVLLIVATMLAVAWMAYGCSPATSQRAACSAAGVALTDVSDRLTHAMAVELSRADTDAEAAALEDRWAPALAAYEAVAAAQRAWADAVEAGEECPLDAVRAAWCGARGPLDTAGVPLPDWPLGGCEVAP